MQRFVNDFFFYIFLAAYLGGMLLYNITGFGYVDEICIACVVFLFIYYMFKQKDWAINKVFLLVFGIFFFYLIYSIKIGSNVTIAIVKDFFIQIKPYLAFFCVYQMAPSINEKQKKLLNQLTLVCWFFLVPIGVAGFINEHYFKYLIGHPTSYAGAVTATALVYLFTSEGTKLNKLIFVGLLSIGLLSGRSKFYGLFIMSAACIYYFDRKDRLKISMKTIFAATCLLVVILFVARHKIEFYFMQGLSGANVETDYLARMALYVTSYSIFQDYFPFGSGLASFGTHFSGVYYSDIYAQYGINYVWGLNKTYTKFVSDTYYPSLAQFGVVGVILYALFWIYIVRKTASFGITDYTIHLFAIVLIIIGFFLIENVADAAFTSNRGIFMMMFLGYIFSMLNVRQKRIHANNHSDI